MIFMMQAGINAFCPFLPHFFITVGKRLRFTNWFVFSIHGERGGPRFCGGGGCGCALGRGAQGKGAGCFGPSREAEVCCREEPARAAESRRDWALPAPKPRPHYASESVLDLWTKGGEALWN